MQLALDVQMRKSFQLQGQSTPDQLRPQTAIV